jgi:hypothetical protein
MRNNVPSTPNGPGGKPQAPKPSLWAGFLAMAFMAAAIYAVAERELLFACFACGAAGLVCGLRLPGVIRYQPVFVRIVLAVFGVAAAYAAWLCFQTMSIAIFVPGLPCAFGAGQLLGMFIRWNPPAD